MIAITGIFLKLQDVELAVDTLISMGIQRNQFNLLTPNTDEVELQKVPTSDTEAPGAGKAFGGFIGGALGAAGGMQMGTAAARLILPGVGPILALGTVAAVFVGAGGAVGGEAFGEYMEDSLNEDLPKDELILYQDALRQGWSVLIVLAKDIEEGEMVKKVLGEAGGESLDAARENWWKALCEAEELEYASLAEVSNEYRQG
jgi:hypothetical protein